jgi:hypothetical protein
MKLCRSHPLSANPPFYPPANFRGQVPLLGKGGDGRIIHPVELLGKMINCRFLPIQNRNVKDFLDLGSKIWVIDRSKIHTIISLYFLSEA